MNQNTDQPRAHYDRTTSCPTCGCLDVTIRGHEMDCKRCWTTTDLSDLRRASTFLAKPETANG